MGFNELKQHGTADFPIELYCLNRQSPKYEMVHHWHQELELIRVLKGNLTVTLGKKEQLLTPGMAVVVNSNTLHAAHPQDCEYQCVVFDINGFLPFQPDCRAFLEEISAGQRVIREQTAGHAAAAESIRQIFLSMERLTAQTGTRFDVLASLYRLYGTLLREKLTEPADSSHDADENTERLKRVLALIRNSYQEPLSLSDMAKVCGMSPQYFCSYFRNMTKHSPMEYLLDYRLSKAGMLLLNTDEPVTQIAFSCGFNDLSYFIKQFKSKKGISPGKFRKQLTPESIFSETTDS